jgi:hypothetical protein
MLSDSKTPLLTQRANTRNHIQTPAVRNLLDLLAPPPPKGFVYKERGCWAEKKNTLQTTDHFNLYSISVFDYYFLSSSYTSTRSWCQQLNEESTPAKPPLMRRLISPKNPCRPPANTKHNKRSKIYLLKGWFDLIWFDLIVICVHGHEPLTFRRI